MAHSLRLLTVLGLLALGGGRKSRSHYTPHSEVAGDCPRCDMLFSMIETTSSGERVQIIETQQRGEPKGGTTFTYNWAHGILLHTCSFLNEWFGWNSCYAVEGSVEPGEDGPSSFSLSFDPRRALDDAKCPCTQIDRVEITINKKGRHTLPVNPRCRFQHENSIAKVGAGCLTVDGNPVQNFGDIARCMEEAHCKVTDRRLQFVIMRDPRAQALSTFYHEKVHSRKPHAKTVGNGEHSLDEFMLSVLPHLCHWMTIRYFLFAGTMAEQSTLLWYEDAVVNTSEWHFDFLASVGLHLPDPVVEHMSEGALRQEFLFMRHSLNEHPGQGEEPVRRKGQELGRRSWKSDISPELMEKMDVVMRQWLPPVVRSIVYDLPS